MHKNVITTGATGTLPPNSKTEKVGLLLQQQHGSVLEAVEFVSDSLRRQLGGVIAIGTSATTSLAVQSAVFRIAADNKIVSHVCRGAAKRADAGNWCELQQLGNTYARNTLANNVFLLAETVSVVDRLAGLSIRSAVMKGPLQQKLLYGNYFAKPSGDIDLLIERRDFRSAVAALAALGFVTVNGSRSIWWRHFLGEQHLVKSDARSLAVDLHHRIQQPGSPAPRSTRAVLDAATPVVFRGRELTAISPADVPLLSAISIVKALYNREAVGSHVVDLFVATRTPAQLNAFLELAEHQRMTGAALSALRAVSLTFGCDFASWQPRIEAALAGIGDQDLLLMVFAPAIPGLQWPKRRKILWELCDRQLLAYLRNAAWAIASEACRLIVEPALPKNADGVSGLDRDA